MNPLMADPSGVGRLQKRAPGIYPALFILWIV